MNQRRLRHFVLIVLSVVVIAVVAACETSSTTTATTSSITNSGYQRPANVQWTDHWNPTPAVDLMSADGTFIRAFIEAESIAVLSGSTATGSYPGFTAANRTGRIPRYYSHGMPTWIYTGFSSHSIVQLANISQDAVTATLCVRESVNPLNDESIHYNTVSLTYRRRGTPPPTDQRGPRNAPTGNVFGDWYATHYDLDYYTPRHEQCKDTPIDRGHTPTPGWPTTTTGDL